MATYSHSRLKTYSQCSLKFLWQYVWQVRPTSQGVEAFLGKRVHESLEVLYRKFWQEGTPLAVQDVIEDYHERWDRQWNDEVRIVRDEEPDYYRRRGGRFLERYYQRHYPFDAGTMLEAEKAFHMPVEPGSSHYLRGFIDRIDVGADGTLEVHDYKTGRPQSARDLETDQQVGFYEAAARYLYPEYRRVRLIWHFLRSGKEQRIESRAPGELAGLRRRAALQIERLEARIERYIRGLDVPTARAFVQAGRRKLTCVPEAARAPVPEFAPSVGPLCRWCSHLDWCEVGSQHAGVPFRPPDDLPPPAAGPPPKLEDPAGEQWSLF